MGCASRRLTAPVAALLSALAALGAGPAPNPAAAIAAAAGHPAGLHLLAQASRTRDGQVETAALEIAGPNRLDRVCRDDVCSGSWFDGRTRQTFGINGTPLPERDEDDSAERTFAAIASTAFAEPAFLAAGGTVSRLPQTDAALRYRVIAPGGRELVAIADARTSRLTGVEFPDRTPYRRLVASVAGTTIVYGARLYERIVAVDTPFVPPAPPRVAVSETRDIPLRSADLPIVPCTLAGRTANCLIDTGTTPSAMTLDLAERLDREPHGSIEIAGLGTYLTGVVDAGPLVLGGATFDHLRFAVIPRVRGATFDVILGPDALANVRIGFDVARRSARVAASTAQPTDTGITVDFSAGVPYAQVRLGSRERSEAMLVDTGDAGLLSIGYDEYREDTGLFTVRGPGSATGLGGPAMDTLQGELAHADVGGWSLGNVAISAVRGQHIGHIGYGLAARCASFVLDLGRHRIECSPKAGDPKAAAGEFNTQS